MILTSSPFKPDRAGKPQKWGRQQYSDEFDDIAYDNYLANIVDNAIKTKESKKHRIDKLTDNDRNIVSRHQIPIAKLLF